MSRAYHSRAANLLGALSLAVSDRLRAAAEAGGLAGSEPAALVTLSHYPGQSIERLRRTLGISHSGAVRLVDRFEEEGLVTRVATGPGRTVAIELTREGRGEAAAILARRRRALEAVVSALSAEERDMLVPVAERLLTALTADRDDAYRLCRLCDEARCVRGAACPVDAAAA